jgi:hypothetical protein
MRTRSFLALTVALALLLGQPGPVSASHNAPRTFVSIAGNDANPCNSNSPCRSFAVRSATRHQAGKSLRSTRADMAP